MRNLLCLFLLAVPTLLYAAAPTVTLTIQPNASVSADTVYLSNVGSIKGAGKDMSGRLNAVPLGRSPMDGVTRTLTVGDISLKLRQAGFDPTQLRFAGAPSVTLTLGGEPPAAPPVSTPSANPDAPVLPAKPYVKAVTIHSGDTITAIYNDGPVSVIVQAMAEGTGSVGDMINVRTSVSGRTLRGQIVDNDTVDLKD